MKRGLGRLPDVNVHTEQVIRFAAFLVPVMLIFYGLLIELDAVHSDRTLNLLYFVTLSLGWLGISVYQFFVRPKTRFDASFRLITYHVFAASYVLLISGLDMPMVGSWIILMLASYTYFGRDGLNLSVFGLFATAVGDVLLHMDNPEYITRSGLFFIGTIIVGYVTTTVVANQDFDRRELARSQDRERLQRDRVLTIVNNLADAILSTDRDGSIQVYNAASLSLLDTNSELRGQSIDEVLHLTDSDNKRFKLVKLFRDARSVQSREDLSATISGETVHLSVIYSPIRSANSHEVDGKDGYIVILRDITKQKSLEEERDEFISVVSHELRTPLTIAEGSLSNVQVMMERSDIPKTTLAENVKVSHDQVLFLAKMVNDLSTLSRAERGVADDVETIDVNTLISDLYAEYASQAQAKGLHFNLDLDPQLGSVTASRLYLKELLQNFVTNAIKYTKAGDVTVSVKKTTDMLHFSVKDTGIGMSKSDQQHVFEKFWRSEDYRTRETGGTGLGLYVAAKLSKKLGTHITMTSRLNHGSTFGFDLPQA